MDLPASDYGICWYKGTEDELYGKEEITMQRIQSEGMALRTDDEGYILFFERYSPKRFFQEDDTGRKILDIGFAIR